MIDKIFKTLFNKKRNVRCITVIKSRDIAIDADLMERRNKIKKQVEKTCLSKFFESRKGLYRKDYCI